MCARGCCWLRSSSSRSPNDRGLACHCPRAWSPLHISLLFSNPQATWETRRDTPLTFSAALPWTPSWSTYCTSTTIAPKRKTNVPYRDSVIVRETTSATNAMKSLALDTVLLAARGAHEERLACLTSDSLHKKTNRQAPQAEFEGQLADSNSV